MDPGAVDSPITLVIKAPNQKYDNQTINCFLNWTVEKLKSHISDVYPSKPSSKEQRLVYSGRLLQDHLQLRDVLRKQDEYHMIHLVCASRSPPESPTPSSRSPTTSPASSPASHPSTSSMAPDSPGFTSWATTSNQDSPHVPSSSSSSPPEAGRDDWLRHRGGFPQHTPYIPTSAGVMQWPGGTQYPLQGGWAAGAPPLPMSMSMQARWWQQMYAHHYYTQYQAAVAASFSSSATLPSLSSPSPQPAPPNEAPAPLGPNPAPNHIPEDRPADPNIQMNAQGGAVMNEEEMDRDWLDWMYTVSRAAILICVVYFYSSFSRFVMVVGAMLLVYLHQAGWFPFRPDIQDPRAGGGVGGGGGGGRGRGRGRGWGVAQQEEGERPHDIQEMERIMDEGMEDEEDDGGGEAALEGEPALHHLGFLVPAWSFISTFFTSLVPEGRPHPAN